MPGGMQNKILGQFVLQQDLEVGGSLKLVSTYHPLGHDCDALVAAKRILLARRKNGFRCAGSSGSEDDTRFPNFPKGQLYELVASEVRMGQRLGDAGHCAPSATGPAAP